MLTPRRRQFWALSLLGLTSLTACAQDGPAAGTSSAAGAAGGAAAPVCTVCDGKCVDAQSDADNCGQCGSVCAADAPSTARCTAGRCLVTLASGLSNASSVAVSTSGAYWTANQEQGAVMTVALDGGAPTALDAAQSHPRNTLADATSVYWVTSDARADYTVGRMPLAGGAATTLASGQRVPYPVALAVDATNLYWVGSTSLFDDSTGVVMKLPLDGDSPSVLASDGFEPAGGLAVDSSHVYWTTHGTSAQGYQDGAVLRVALSGGAVSTLAADQHLPGSIAVDSSSVYWTTIDGVLKVPLDGGTPVALVANASPSGLLLDAGNLYWINDADSSAGGSILKMPVAGGTPVTLASAQLTLNSLSVDATSVYWTNEGTISEITDDGFVYDDGTLLKLTPK